MSERCTCSCGCGTVVVDHDHIVGSVTDRYVYDGDGTLDYIELYVEGHDPLGDPLNGGTFDGRPVSLVQSLGQKA
jgi:hypothetical protein